MSLEQTVASENSFYFLPEFTFSNNTFTPPSGTEVELADGIIWLGDRAVIFQLKERTIPWRSVDARDKWFKAKVVRDATKQIRDTICYLDDHVLIVAKNQRGQSVSLAKNALKELHKIILYSCGESFSYRPCHVSTTAGFIHLLNVEDYNGILRTLLTPAELFEYLNWRENLLISQPEIHALPEQSLLGHFLLGDFDAKPSLQHAKYISSIEQSVESWDVSGILHKFLERSYDGADDLEYHRMLAEIAKLNRAGLAAFKDRFKLSMDKSKENELTQPYRFHVQSTDCGFVFIPLEAKDRERRRELLRMFTELCKYDMKVSKCVGAVFLADDDGWFTVDWCFIERPWEEDGDTTRLLEENQIFRPIRTERKSRYTFSSD